MKLVYVVREAEIDDIDEIRTIMQRRQKKFMARLTISLILSNWYLTFKYFAIGAFACLNFESIVPIFPCVIVVPVFLLIEVVYSFVVTRFSMKASMKTIDKRVREGNTPQHQVWVVRRIGALVGLISLRDEAKTNLCLECDMFHCHEETDMARTFVLRHTLKTALSIAEDRKFAMVLFRCCDIFPDVVASFESLGFDLIMIHRVMILFSSILMLTFTKVLMLPDDLRESITVHIPGLLGPDPLTDTGGEPVQATASVVSGGAVAVGSVASSSSLIPSSYPVSSSPEPTTTTEGTADITSPTNTVTAPSAAPPVN